MNGWLIAAILIALWGVLLYVLYRKGYITKDGNISLFGPALMLKTRRGKRFIERVGQSRFWEAYGYVGIFLSFMVMIFVFALLLWQAVMVLSIPASRAPSPVEALGIPGINPIIPIWYGILGLVVAIIFHEFAHGFLVAFHKMKILALGVLLFIVPIGAFVEPDEDELASAERIKRMHVYAAGPTTNIVLAVIFLLLFAGLFSMITPAHSGMYISEVYATENSKVLQAGDIISAINGTAVRSIDDFYNVNAPMPGKKVNVEIYRNSLRNVSATSGVYVISVSVGYPAQKAGIKPGWIFYSINGTVIRNENEFFAALNHTIAGEKINIVMLNGTKMENFTVTLADKYQYYEKYAPELNKESYKGKGFLGVSAMYLGIGVGDPQILKEAIANPYHNAKNFNDIFRGGMFLISLPFAGLMPFPQPLENVYSVPFPGFWLVVNSLYWIFWLNLMLGLTNLLPAVPLDGGYLFSDLMTYLSKKLKARDPEAMASKITTFFSILVLVLIIWQFIGPRI
ncbi:MAG: PDZ domain-containing protein [Euryarchaeota archaeon]|nr:PDZ domain-containing protein [Euryarchaeota archaeon]